MAPSAAVDTPKAPAAKFEPDISPAKPIPRHSHELSLSAETAALLESNSAANQQHVLIAALRILHFRYSAVEYASIASFPSEDAHIPLNVSLPMDADMPLQEAVEMVNLMMVEAKSKRGFHGPGDEGSAGILVDFSGDGSRQNPKSA